MTLFPAVSRQGFPHRGPLPQAGEGKSEGLPPLNKNPAEAGFLLLPASDVDQCAVHTAAFGASAVNGVFASPVNAMSSMSQPGAPVALSEPVRKRTSTFWFE